MTKHTPPLLYCHIPKAGGTTLNAWLFEATADPDHTPSIGQWYLHGVFYYPSGYVMPERGDAPELVRKYFARADLRSVVGHFCFGLHEALSRPSLQATVLREPLSRVRSLWRFHNMLMQEKGHVEGEAFDLVPSLARFVSSPPYTEVDNGMVRRLSGVGRSVPIGSCDNEMLRRAKTNLDEAFDVVGLTERFDETLMLLADALGIDEPPICHMRNTNTQDAPEIGPEDSAAIHRHNALDIELYAYAQQLFEQQVRRMGEAMQDRLARYRYRVQTPFK